MLLKCIDGPMDGAVYSLDRQSKQTTRKPDGLWFDAQIENGGWVQHQYGFDHREDEADSVTLIYRFGGSVSLLVAGEQQGEVMGDDVHDA